MSLKDTMVAYLVPFGSHIHIYQWARVL